MDIRTVDEIFLQEATAEINSTHPYLMMFLATAAVITIIIIYWHDKKKGLKLHEVF